MRNQRTTRSISRIALILALTIGALFAIGPVIWMISTSFKTGGDVFAYPPSVIPEVWTLDAYTAVLSDPGKLRFFLNSYIVSLSVVAITTLIAILAAYALSRHDFPFKKTFDSVILGIQAVPPITLLIPYFGLIVAFRLYDTYLALILTYVVFTVPYSIVMLTAYFNTVPRSLDEAVRIDGGGTWRTLWSVIVPIAGPGIVPVATYSFMIAWNEFLFALTLTKSRDMRTVPVGIQLLMGEHSYQWNEMMAMSVLGSIPVVILFLFFQRQLVSGMTDGAVKA